MVATHKKPTKPINRMAQNVAAYERGGVRGAIDNQRAIDIAEQQAQQEAYARAMQEARDSYSPILGVSGELMDERAAIPQPRKAPLFDQILQSNPWD